MLFVVLNDWIFFLDQVQVAQCIGEPSGVGDLMLAGPRNVLHPIREKGLAAAPCTG